MGAPHLLTGIVSDVVGKRFVVHVLAARHKGRSDGRKHASEPLLSRTRRTAEVSL